jgi:hypothetical protein
LITGEKDKDDKALFKERNLIVLKKNNSMQINRGNNITVPSSDRTANISETTDQMNQEILPDDRYRSNAIKQVRKKSVEKGTKFPAIHKIGW